MAWIGRKISQTDVRLVSVCLSILFALPLGWGAFMGISIWLSPFVMLNSLFVLKSLVWLNGLAVFTLVLIIWRKRWFCRKLCPLGWGCDQVSSWRKGRGYSIKRLPPVGKWLAISSLVAAFAGIPLFILLDPMSIFNAFFVIFSREVSLPIVLSFMGLPLILSINLLFPGIWCAKLCPLGGLQDEISTVKSVILRKQDRQLRTRTIKSAGRRIFLVSGAGLLTGLLLPSFLKPGKKSYLQPPGSVPPEQFSTLCLRCGSCIKSCPTDILGHRLDPLDKLSCLVPEITFSKGYCLEECNTCSRVCPSGAISLFSKEAKDQLFIGLAKIEIENCLLLKNKECDRCKAACSYDAIQIVKVKGGLQVQPEVNPDTCVGCGACVLICPPRVIEIVPFT